MIELLLSLGIAAQQPPSVQPPSGSSSCPNGVVVRQGQPCPPSAPPPVMIYFAWNSSNLSDQARASLDAVVASFRQGGFSGMTLTAHTDRSGTAAYNLRLASRYAAAVRDYLVRAGVPASAIKIQTYGERRPLVETPDGVREPQNRRVELLFSPPIAKGEPVQQPVAPGQRRP